MKVILSIDWLGRDLSEPAARQHKSGDTISVYHVVGCRLLNRRQAKWISQESFDPPWEPIEQLRYKQAIPQHNRMVQGGLNK